jgi:nucleoside 2-deoxyribosyltransferase
MGWVKKRIAGASLVIADLSDANPNVYLEVGYAWGRGRPTVLLVRDSSQLKLDVQGQRCLIYKKIKDLETSLRAELENLKPPLPDSVSEDDNISQPQMWNRPR